ncbi:neuropeptide Y receptor type 1-like [Branchiostoma floridae]|uniref:Neuropeptide Y receptor type 1-like n=1 Tax=Branchiostoma floridae TaxID=7739 RepID=A0A9J7LCZ8_BRAFL|nr:neuropeptide Y receptor type 1-like [Branchiostoma floridae]
MENVTNVSLNHGDSSEEDYADLDDIYAATEHSVPWAFQVGTAVVYAVVLLGCGTNNACRLARACRQPPRKRHIVEANLRMADFLLVVFGVPLIFQYHTVTPFAWYWGSAVCTAYTYGKAVLQGVASHLFLVLEIDRCQAICCSTRAYRLSTPRACLVCLVAWLFSIVASLPFALYSYSVKDSFTGSEVCLTVWPAEALSNYQLYSTAMLLTQCAAPCVLSLTCSLLVLKKIWSRRFPTCQPSVRGKVSRKSKTKATILLCVVLFFFACLTPSYLLPTLASFNAIGYDWSHQKFLTAVGVAEALTFLRCVFSMGFFVGQPNQPSLRNITSGKEGCATRHKTGNVIPSSDDVETVQVQLKRVRRLEH